MAPTIELPGIEVPCVELPRPPDLPEIELIGGAKLTAFLDASKGLPNDCQVTLNLLGQLAPVLAALGPILQILNVISALQKFATNPLVNGPDLLEAIGKIAGLLTSLQPAVFAKTLLGVLRLVVSFIACVISLLKSSVSLQADIALARSDLELSLEPPSAVLTASLDCAEANAAIALEQATAMLGPIAPLMEVIGAVAGIVGIELTLPSLDVSGAADTEAAVAQLEAAVDALNDALEVVATIAGS